MHSSEAAQRQRLIRRYWSRSVFLLAVLQLAGAVSAGCVYNLSRMNVYMGMDCGGFCLHSWHTEPDQVVYAPGVGGKPHILNRYFLLILSDVAGLEFNVEPYGHVAIFWESPNFCNYHDDDTLIAYMTANPGQLDPPIPVLSVPDLPPASVNTARSF